MKKISAYVITLGMLLTMLPNTAMPAAAAVRSSLTAEDSTQKSAIQGSWKELSGSMLTVHDDNAFILIDADGTYCKGTVKQEDNLNANISQLSGKWREAGALNRTLNIDVNGNYTLTNTDGTKSTGKAKIKLAEHGSGNQPELLYMLYNEKGNLELSFHSVSQLAISGGQDEVHGIRFVNSELVAKEADISYLSGKWNYEEQNTKNPAAYDAAGTITVANDWTYTYQPADGSAAKKGIILLSFDDQAGHLADSDRIPRFDFYDEKGAYWFGCFCEQNDPHIYYTGNGGPSRLVRFKEQEQTANQYGYYDVTDAPATGISIKALEGKWAFDDVDIMIYDGSIYSGKFKVDLIDGTKKEGTVKLQYRLKEKGTEVFRYVLYTADGNKFTAFEVTGTLPLDSLMTADETSPVEFVRVKEETKGDITGDGTISADDAQITLTAYTEALAGNKTNLTGAQKAAADVDGNGTITVEDAQLILNYYTEKYIAGKNITWDDLLQKA